MRTLDEETIKAILGDPRLMLPVVAAVCWISILFPPVSYLALVVPLLGAYALANNRKWAWIPVLVLLHPMPAFFLAGLLAYAGGTPHLLVNRPLERLLPRLDRDTRAELLSVEARFPWGGWIRPVASNAGVRLATSLFGPAKGAYTGYIPQRREIESELYGGTSVPLAMLLEDRIVLEDRTITLTPGLGERLFNGFGFSPPTPADAPETLTVYARMLEKRCLMVAVQQFIHESQRAVAVYIDAENGKAFACDSFGMPTPVPDFSYFDE